MSPRPVQPASSPGAPPDSRPILAIISGHLTPYREHWHRRVVAEFPEMRLATLITKRGSTFWTARPVEGINTVLFETRDAPAGGYSRLGHLRNEVGKGRALLRWLSAHDVRALVIGGYDEIPNLMALRWARRRGIPAFLQADSNARGDLAAGAKRVAKDFLVPLLVRRFTGVLVCGRLGKDFFARYGGDRARMFVAPVEPDYSLIEGLADGRVLEIARELGLDPARRRLVVCCRLIRIKRVDEAIDAFAGIAAERPEWDLLIVGEGPERAALESRVPEPLRGRVRFLGFLDQERVAAVYRLSHALTHPSAYEPWGLVINEAACAGMAIVASDVTGAAVEIVRDGVSGRLVPVGDAGALAAALREVTDPARIDAAREASRRELVRWRDEGDPMKGLRRALRAAGVLADAAPPAGQARAAPG